MNIRAGIGFDIHRFAPGRRLVLAGVCMPCDLGLEGHSDADVVCHAVMDALLGAVAEGDIGTHFPDTDDRWREARSLDLLRTVTNRVTARGWQPSNIDVTILAENPRVMPWLVEMRTNLAGAVGISPACVSVKATTTEGLGAIGRGEGIAALAVATLCREEKSDASV